MRASAIWGLMAGLAGPPVLPDEAPEQPAPPVEPAPVEPAPVEPALAPEPPPEPAPPEEPPLPAWDQPLPSYDQAPIAPDVPFDGTAIEDEEPPSGRGRQAVGAILVSGGVVLTATAATLVALDQDQPVWIPGVVIGSSAAITGAILLATGTIRRAEHKAWAARQADGPVPPRGQGMAAAGITCIVAGSMGTIIGAVSLTSFQDADALPYGEVLVPLGTASVVTGVGLLIGSGVRSKKHQTWESGRVAPTLSLLPGARSGPSIGGLSLGVAARF